MQLKATKCFVLLKQKNLTMRRRSLGSYRKDLTYNQKHIDSVLALDLVDVEAIKKSRFPGSY